MIDKDSIKIRELNQKDVSKTKDFMLGVIKDDFGYDFNPVWHWDIDNLTETYVMPETSMIYLAEFEEEIVGTIAARAYDREYKEFINKYSKENTLSIWRHYVKKDLRGHKVGTRLLKEIESFAKSKGFKYIYLHTQRTIPGSLEYWLARGFDITIDTNDEFQTVHLEKILRK